MPTAARAHEGDGWNTGGTTAANSHKGRLGQGSKPFDLVGMVPGERIELVVAYAEAGARPPGGRPFHAGQGHPVSPPPEPPQGKVCLPPAQHRPGPGVELVDRQRGPAHCPGGGRRRELERPEPGCGTNGGKGRPARRGRVYRRPGQRRGNRGRALVQEGHEQVLCCCLLAPPLGEHQRCALGLVLEVAALSGEQPPLAGDHRAERGGAARAERRRRWPVTLRYADEQVNRTTWLAELPGEGETGVQRPPVGVAQLFTAHPMSLRGRGAGDGRAGQSELERPAARRLCRPAPGAEPAGALMRERRTVQEGAGCRPRLAPMAALARTARQLVDTDGVVLSSANRGRSWSASSLPGGTLAVMAISCPGRRTYFALAAERPRHLDHPRGLCSWRAKYPFISTRLRHFPQPGKCLHRHCWMIGGLAWTADPQLPLLAPECQLEPLARAA